MNLKISTNGSAGNNLVIGKHVGGAFAPAIAFAASDGTEVSPTIVGGDDPLGQINFYGYDGNSYALGGYIAGQVDGAVSDGDMPMRLAFYTSADGTESPTERMRISANGHIALSSAGFGQYDDEKVQINGDNTGTSVALALNNPKGYGVGVGLGYVALDFTRARSSSDNNYQMARIMGYNDSETSSAYGGLTLSTRNSGTLTESIRIDSNQRVLIGDSTYIQNWYGQSGISDRILNVYHEGGNSAITAVAASTSNEQSAQLNLAKMSTADLSAFSQLAENEDIGRISFQGADGTYLQEAAYIKVDADGTTGAADMPGRIEFGTTADGASSPTERMRIDSAGRVSIGGTSDYAAVFFSKSSAETNAALHLASNTQTAAGYKVWTGLGSVTPTSGTLSFTIGQVGGTSPRAAMFEINVVGRHANNGASYHALLQFQVFIQLSSTQAVSLRAGGETGISYIWDYATDVSFTNNGNGTCTIDLDIRPYVSTAYWTIIRKSSAWTAELQSVSYS